MSIFEALGVRKRMELCCEVVEKLGEKYMRPTGEGVQCAACGMFVVGPELKFARIAPFFFPRRLPPFFSRLGRFGSPQICLARRHVMDHLAFQHTGDMVGIIAPS